MVSAVFLGIASFLQVLLAFYTFLKITALEIQKKLVIYHEAEEIVATVEDSIHERDRYFNLMNQSSLVFSIKKLHM